MKKRETGDSGSSSHPRNSRRLIADGASGQAADKPYSLLFNGV